MSQPSEGSKSFMQKLLDVVERVGNKVPHTAVLFLVLIAIVVVLSTLLELVGASVTEEVITAEENAPAYPPFNLAEDAPAVRHAKRAAESIGLKPTAVYSNGGLDANWLVKHGLPTVTFGAGQYEVHTVKEYVHLPEFANGCRLAVALATLEG